MANLPMAGFRHLDHSVELKIDEFSCRPKAVGAEPSIVQAFYTRELL
jgi:hypothetical protein